MRNLTASPPVTHLLRLSITEQIESVILANPDCNRTASLKVDGFLVCSECLGDEEWF